MKQIPKCLDCGAPLAIIEYLCFPYKSVTECPHCKARFEIELKLSVKKVLDKDAIIA